MKHLKNILSMNGYKMTKRGYEHNYVVVTDQPLNIEERQQIHKAFREVLMKIKNQAK